MSLDTYNSLTETNYLLSDPANRARLLASLQEAKTGRTVVKSLDDIDRLIVKKKRQQKHEGRVH